MVEIIGKDATLKKQVTCTHCTSILSYIPSEVQSNTYTDYGGGRDIHYWITCPCCTKQITVRRP